MSREAILGGIRRGPLSAEAQAVLQARLARPPRHIIPARGQLPRPAMVALFLRNLEKEFASADRVAVAADIPEAVADYLAMQNLPPRFVLAPHPELESLPWASRPMLGYEVRRAQPDDQVSVQHGFAGIAETGTLMLPSGPERPTTLNILAETAIVVLRASRVVAAFEDAWDRLRAEHRDALTGGWMPRNVMLVTGPSRSADIEQTLELGAHGPRRLHLLLLEDDPAALPEIDAGEAPAPGAAANPAANTADARAGGAG